MRREFGIIRAWTAALAVLAGGVAFAEPSRCTLGEAKFMSWAPRERPWTLKAGLLHLDAKADAETSFAFNRKNDARFIAAYASGPSYRIAFAYRSTAKATLKYNINTMEKPTVSPWHEKAIPVSADWTTFTWDATAPELRDCEDVELSVKCAKGAGFIEIRDLSIVDVAPADKSGKPLRINGAKATEVCLYGTDTPRRRLNDLRAALMFRFALRAAGGEWLPVREVATADEAGANAVLVGRLAVDAGVVAASEQAKVEGLTGGWATAAKGSRLGLAGAVPCGVQRGVWRTLERLGVVYLGTDMFKPFAGKAFETGDFAETRRPATAFPLAGDRNGLNAELRGWAVRDCVFGAHAIGSVPEANVLTCDSLGFIVPVSEFRDSHPEYFALQKNGTRLTDEAHAKGLTHFCWTAPGLAELVAERYLEMMRALPEQPVWLVAPGDGGGLNCTCEKCRALGSDSDGLVRLANRIAELTSREFPENRIWIYSYVDTPEPPTKPVKAHPNLNIGYCVYPSDYWPSCMLIPHPSNEKGEKALAGWRATCCPNLSLVAYYSQCGEWMTLWPGFDADVWLTRDFSEHNSFLTYRFGMHSTHRSGGIGDASSFVDLIIYVLSRLEVDPKLDAHKLAYEFIDLYYGAAAKPIRAFFDLAQAEPHKRNWVQGCEQHLKGFVTKEFAAKAFPLLDEAERLAADDPALLHRVRKPIATFYWSYLDGIGRGRGNVSAEERKPWARRVAHFAQICAEEGGCYMGSVTPKQWFHDNMMYDIDTPGHIVNWPKDRKVRALVADPEKELAGDFPNLQRKTADGYEIPAAGMMGGAYQKNSFWRQKEACDVRIARRESSGLGLVFTRLDLESVPEGPASMTLRGIDNEKASVAEVEIKVNGKALYRGPVKWGKDAHSDWKLDVPAGVLRAGGNEIQLLNTTRDTEKDGEGGDRFRATRNYFWGWFMLDKISIRFGAADEKPYLKAGFLTDTHVRPNAEEINARTRKAFAVFKAQGVDVIGHCGDLADLHYPEAYAYYRDCIEKTYPDAAARPKLLYVYANHDVIDVAKCKAGVKGLARQMPYREGFRDMRERLGIGHGLFHREVVNGVPFLVFPQSFEIDGGAARVEKMLAETAAEFPTGPIVVMGHNAPAKTVYRSERWGYWGYRQILDKYPRVISFSGHTHGSLRNEAAFWQGTFSAVDVCCLEWWYGDAPFDGKSKSSYGVVVAEFYRDRVVIRRFDVRDGSEFRPDIPWVVRQPYDPADGLTNERRQAAEPVPTFPDGAALTLERAGKNLRLSFPPVRDEDSLLGYRIDGAATADGVPTVLVKSGLHSQFCLRPGERAAKLTKEIPLSWFQTDVDYGITVTPVAFFGTEGRPLKGVFRH